MAAPSGGRRVVENDGALPPATGDENWGPWSHWILPQGENPVTSRCILPLAPVTQQRRHSRLYPGQFRLVLDLVTPEECNAELTYLAWLHTEYLKILCRSRLVHSEPKYLRIRWIDFHAERAIR